MSPCSQSQGGFTEAGLAACPSVVRLSENAHLCLRENARVGHGEGGQEMLALVCEGPGPEPVLTELLGAASHSRHRGERSMESRGLGPRDL